MTADLIFYTSPMSRGRTVRWMLEELGVPYETVLVDLADVTEDFRSINPMMKVPVIVHRGRVVTETAAICAYLAEAFPASGLAPTADERADYYRWLFFAAGPVEAAGLNKALGFDVPVEQKRMVGYGDLERVADTLALATAGDGYIAGERFTAADVFVGSLLGWMTSMGMIPSRPSFAAYLGRIMSRPASVRAREIDDALIAAPQ
jgi:glutathione S-transferase